MRRAPVLALAVLLTAALLLPVRAPAADGTATLLAGAAVTDITPETGRELFGYVRPDISADGVALRLTSRALVLRGGEETLALVTVDLGAPPQGAKDEVLARVADLGFTARTLLLAGTHTHAGPDVFFGGDDWIYDQIAESIRVAHRRLAPAVAGWASVRLENASDNRSVEAHLANHGLDLTPGLGRPRQDPHGPDHTIDPVLRLLRVERPGGRPLAAWAHFSAHTTTFIPSNTYYSADWAGVGVRRFEERLGPGAIAIYTNGNEGDQSPRFAGYNQHSAADEMGRRAAAAMDRAWRLAGGALSRRLVLDARTTDACFCGQELSTGHRVSPVPYWGLAFFGGAEDGPSIFYEPLATEGRRRPAGAGDPIHGRKILVAPAPFTPQPEVQALRVGDRLLLSVPGEATVQMGRRIRRAALERAPGGITDALVVGLANDFTGYYTTPREYDQQHYEGGHTVFGKWSGDLLIATHQDLARSLREPPEQEEPAAGDPPAPADPHTGDGGVDGELLEQPSGRVERMETVEIAWSGAEDGRDRPVGEAFVMVERRTRGGWRAVDSDLGYALAWQERDGVYRARYDVRPSMPPGRYRLEVRSGSYALVTRPFRIVASDDLRVRGVRGRRTGSRTELLFLAQNPPPDPERNLLSRDRTPSGGTLQFRLGDRRFDARWDPGARGWVAVVPGDAVGSRVRLPKAALTDGLGNRSGKPVTLRLGEVAPLEWPAGIAAGGGKTPGFGGQGTWPP